MPVARSLRARVLIWVGIALIVLFAATILILDLTFRQTIDRSRAELLEAQLFGLIALAESDAAGNLTLPDETINPQFGVADSGLFGVLWDGEGNPVWQSSSLVGRAFPAIEPPADDGQRYLELEISNLPRLEALVMAVSWEMEDGRVIPYTFGTAVSLAPYEAQQAAFRRNLIGWFMAITVTMLVVVLGVLGWVLRPVRRLARQVREVESGDLARLEGDFPTELIGLAGNLNALIDTERRRLTRYRNTLDDLAHSLKTPLAAMRALVSESREPGMPVAGLEREIDRMDQRVSYQLRRARASGATGLGVEPTRLAPVLEDLKFTLDKVYRDKGVGCELAVAEGTVFHGDPGDLTEILGNLLENAYKYCSRRVRIGAHNKGRRVVVTVDDDGAGMTEQEFQSLVERGTRADESQPGQGIGLAVVRETAELYSGNLSVSRSVLGGARVRVELGRAGLESD